MVRELLSGNVPGFMRRLVEVDASGPDSTGNMRSLKIRVMPDYLCVGDDADYVRLPLNPLSAQTVANEFGCVLPTRKMVDIIWKAAAVKLEPAPMTPDSLMSTTRRFVEHNARVEGQFRAANASAGALVSGHKKDVVVTNRLINASGRFLHRVAIYGWHRLTGSVIQGLNASSHDDKYADYSHGVRLIALDCVLEGSPADVRDVLRDPVLCGLLSDEGPMRLTAYPLPVMCPECGRTFLDSDGHPDVQCKMSSKNL